MIDFLFIFYLLSSASADTCVISDHSDKIYIFGSSFGDFQLSQIPASLNLINTSKRPDFNIPDLKCFTAAYSNSIFMIHADSKSPNSLYTLDLNTMIYSNQPMDVSALSTIPDVLNNLSIILDHDTITFYTLYGNAMYFLNTQITPLKWILQRSSLFPSSYSTNAVVSLSQNHLHFLNIPANAKPGQAQIYVIHYAYWQPELQTYSGPLFPQIHGKTVSIPKSADTVPLEFAFIPDDFSGVYLVNADIQVNTTILLDSPVDKDKNSKYAATSTQIIQMNSENKFWILNLEKNQQWKEIVVNFPAGTKTSNDITSSNSANVSNTPSNSRNNQSNSNNGFKLLNHAFGLSKTLLMNGDNSQDEIKQIKIQDVIDQMTIDLLETKRDDIVTMMGKLDIEAHYAIEFPFIEFVEKNLFLSELLVSEPARMIPLLDKALVQAQIYVKKTHPMHNHLQVKNNAHVRIDRPQACGELNKDRVPRSQDVGKMVFFQGKVVRTGMVKMLETEKQFECMKCNMPFSMLYDREQYNLVPKPYMCLATNACASTKFKEVVLEAGQLPNACKDYQEIKIQENLSKLEMGTIPRSISVILEDDLVDSCKAGDDVTVTGYVFRRWKSFQINERCAVEIAIFANCLNVHNIQHSSSYATEELKVEFNAFWAKYKTKPISGRNIILKSFCPKIYGMYITKLAVMLTLVGGVSKTDNKMKIRGDSHLLLVGDPGTGKSQFLRYAAKVSQRCVSTTGIGSTNAGLTVAAVKDSGEWQLEAGALVLADRGICCIDEFGSIRETDKTAIHEAMEQQSISVAKAGLVCKLNTRCSILASTNPKGKYDTNQGIEVNIALASPLLSRFDLILILLDSQNNEWDESVSTFLLDNEVNPNFNSKKESENWSMDKMKAFLIHIRSSFDPILTEEANLILKAYYQAHRSSDLRNVARTTIRLLESLIRLSQSHARLMCQNNVSVRDAVFAVLLMESSMQTCAINNVSSSLHAPFPDDPEDDYFKQEEVLLERLNLSHLSTKDHQIEAESDLSENLNETIVCSWECTPRQQINSPNEFTSMPIALLPENYSDLETDNFEIDLLADLGMLDGPSLG